MSWNRGRSYPTAHLGGAVAEGGAGACQRRVDGRGVGGHDLAVGEDDAAGLGRVLEVEAQATLVHQQAAEKRIQAVILSEATYRPVRGEAKNLALSVFKAMRDPSSPAAPQDDSPKGFFRSLPDSRARLRRWRW